MFKTIFQRLFWTSTAIIFLVVVIVSSSMFGLLSKYVLDERMSSAQKASKSIEYLTTAIAFDENSSYYRRMYDSTLASWSMMVEADISVINQSGSTFAATNQSRTVPHDIAQKVLEGNTIHTRISTGSNAKRLDYIIGIPISYKNRVIGGIFYYYPPGINKSTVREFSSIVFLLLIGAMLFALCLIYWESRRISEPLKEINNAVLEIASGKFDKRVNVYSGDELGQLASSFNYMANSLKQLEEMRASFISDVSHELRTPMTSISGFVAGILDGTIPKERQEEYLKIVLEESTRLSRLTNELFEMSKMASPEYKLQIKPFNLNEVVRLCIISAEHQIDKKNLELDVWFEHDTFNVLADPDAIKRVLINLLDNAIKFSFPKTTITIRVFEKDHHAVFEIINYGVGISDEDIPHIFDRFYKSDKSRNRSASGAGLGLSFVKNIINLHSQQITVSSTKGIDNSQKTTFSFTLEKA